MNSQSIMRYCGGAAIVSALLYVVSVVAWMGGDPTGAPPPLAATAYAVGSLLFLAVLYALFLIHRGESFALSVGAVLLLGVSVVASLFLDPSDLSNPLIPILNACYGVGALLLGWLALRSPRLPNGVGILAMLMGALSLAMLPFMFAGATETVEAVNLVIGLLYVVWLCWLGWIFIKSVSTSAQPA
ncbi:MAG: hypothetical protein HC802_05025 [Caldilineaceae bacterium]|nr:hypothetical protein [Caldilineaceae bacterium]